MAKRKPLTFLNSGEPDGIGATSLLLNDEIVMDYGIRLLDTKDPDGTTIRRQYAPDCGRYRNKQLKGVLISHDHLDHLGALPQLMIPEHKNVPFYISEEAGNGARVMLEDSLKIARNAEREALENQEAPPVPIFTKEELGMLDDADIYTTGPGEWIGQPDGYKFGFYPIGHNVGARCTAIVTPDGWPVFWTGDASAHDALAKGVMLPDDENFGKFVARPNRVMITEATNGARRSPATREELEKRLIKACAEVINRGGSILFPSFANQRAGNLVMILRSAMDRGLLPDTPIHIDGLARAMVVLQVPDARKLWEQEKLIFIEYDNMQVQPGKAHRQMLADGTDPCGEQAIVISSSGDLRQGPAVFHAMWIAEDPKNAIFFPGYIFPGSPAKEIFANRLQKGFTIALQVWKEKKMANIRCDVQHFELSAHDWQEALVERVRLFSPAHLIVHHCPPGDFPVFKQALLDNLPNPPAIYHAAYKKKIVIDGI